MASSTYASWGTSNSWGNSYSPGTTKFRGGLSSWGISDSTETTTSSTNTPSWSPFPIPTRAQRQNLNTQAYIEDPSPTSPTFFPSTTQPKKKLTALLSRTGINTLLQKARSAAHWHRIKHSKVNFTFNEVDYTGTQGRHVRWARRELSPVPASPRGAPDFAMARREFQRVDDYDRLYDEVYRGDENRLRALLDLEGDYPEGGRQLPFTAEDIDAINLRLYELRKSEEARLEQERSWRDRIKWPRW